MQPPEKVGHEAGHPVRRRADVLDLIAAHHGHGTCPVASGSVQERPHENLVGAEQMGFARGIPFPVAILDLDGVARLLDVAERPRPRAHHRGSC